MNLKIGSIQAKLNLIVDYLNELEPLTSLNMSEIINDIYKYRAAERLQELIIQASLDLGRHLLKEQYQIHPRENSSVFLELAKVNIIPTYLGELLAKAASFRNVLVHIYGTINPGIVVDNIPLMLRDFFEFLSCIYDYLDSLEANNDDTEF